MPRAVYLDCNATTPLRPEAKSSMLAALDVTGNPSSVHRFGRDARRLVEGARAAVAALAGVAPSWVVFTSGATEANGAVLAGVTADRRLASAVEHDSVLAVTGIERIAVTPAGQVDLRTLDTVLARGSGPAVVSVMAANNETGVIQPMAEVAAIARRHGALVHCDAVQAAGRLALPEAAGCADLITLSAHKLGGPAGVGAVIADPAIAWRPLLRGGGQERRQRAGTEAVALIAGFGAAAAAALGGLDDAGRLAGLRERIERGIRSAAPDAVVYGAGSPRLANTVCVAMPGVPAATQVMAFDLAGIAVSAGSACSSGKVAASHVLAAMGVPAAEAATAIRVSLGWHNDAADADRFVEEWRALHLRTARLAATG